MMQYLTSGELRSLHEARDSLDQAADGYLSCQSIEVKALLDGSGGRLLAVVLTRFDTGDWKVEIEEAPETDCGHCVDAADRCSDRSDRNCAPKEVPA